ncbi:MAG: O-antigen ligase family protein [Eubacterium sp.]
MALEGFLKYLCIFLFVISLWQIDSNDRERLLDAVPLSAAIMTFLAIILGLFSDLHLRFYDANEDLHGFFEYANAYAVFLLVGLIILIFRHKNKILSVICAIPCIYGIYASNSRAVWILSIFMLIIIAGYFTLKKTDTKKKKIIFFSVVSAVLIVGVAVLAFTGYLEKIFNYINTDGSVNERYLYYKDALLYSMKHPFGKGAYAFYFAQPQFQSAYYYAMDVHNDYLQIMIEAGIIPSLMFIALLVMQFFLKKNTPVKKFVLMAIAIHCAFDYDLQFASIFFILTLCIDYPRIEEVKINSKLIAIVITAVIIGMNSIIGISNFLNYTGKHDKSVYFYKNTPSMLILMESTNQQQSGYDYATDILSINDSIFEANNVLSNIYAENQRYEEAIEQMEIVIEKDPRTMQHYRDYIDLCVEAEKYYKKEGENEKSQSCIEKILSVPNKIKDLKDNTDERGIKYGRKQKFNLGKEYKKIIKSYK